MIYITEKAAKQIEIFSQSEGVGHNIVRVRVIGGGCAGFGYDMYYDDKITAMDEVFEMENVKVVVDTLSFQYLDGSTVDFVESPLGGGFKFINPNVKSSCGCGNSFSV